MADVRLGYCRRMLILIASAWPSPVCSLFITRGAEARCSACSACSARCSYIDGYDEAVLWAVLSMRTVLPAGRQLFHLQVKTLRRDRRATQRVRATNLAAGRRRGYATPLARPAPRSPLPAPRSRTNWRAARTLLLAALAVPWRCPGGGCRIVHAPRCHCICRWRGAVR